MYVAPLSPPLSDTPVYSMMSIEYLLINQALDRLKTKKFAPSYYSYSLGSSPSPSTEAAVKGALPDVLHGELRALRKGRNGSKYVNAEKGRTL